MTARIVLAWLVIGTVGCDHRERGARIDADVDLALLRGAGIFAHIEETEGNAAERLAAVRSQVDADETVIVISPTTVVASYGRLLDERLPNKRASHTLAWSHAFVHEGNHAGAVRAAARGLLFDAMSVGLVRPQPLAPLDPPQGERLSRERPSRRGAWGPLLALVVAFLGLRRMPKGEGGSGGGAAAA